MKLLLLMIAHYVVRFHIPKLNAKLREMLKDVRDCPLCRAFFIFQGDADAYMDCVMREQSLIARYVGLFSYSKLSRCGISLLELN